jgi:SAM-dependent methyltransferase
MGDKNQEAYLIKYLPAFNGSVLEVGSKDYGNTASFRNYYTTAKYVGIDLEEGKGVDVIVDLVKGIAPLENSHFDLAICCSVMEHVNKPWKFAENLSSLIKVGGLLYISVPWVWRYHPYPDDYWRFSWRGIMELYPGFHWENIEYSTNVYGEFFPASPGNDDRMCLFKESLNESC